MLPEHGFRVFANTVSMEWGLGQETRHRLHNRLSETIFQRTRKRFSQKQKTIHATLGNGFRKNAKTVFGQH